MPFITACPFCPAKLKVPDQSLGMSMRCPKCGDYFTVAPEELAPTKAANLPPLAARLLSPPPPPPVSPPPPASPPADLPWWVAPTVGAAPAPVAPEPEPPPPPPPPPIPSPVAFEAPTSARAARPAWLNSWGAVAFFLAALALLLAAFALPRMLVLPIAALGVLTSLVGIAAALEGWEIKDAVWLSLGGGGSLLVLILTAFLPSWLSNEWGMDFDVPEPEASKPLMVSRDNKTVDKELTGDDRIDAEKNAFRRGDVLIRVESVVVDRVAEKGEPALLITLQIANAGQLHPVIYHGQAGTEHRAVARDSRGTELKRRDLGEQARKAGQLPTVSVLPNHEVNDVLAFEPPWPGTAHVDVDLPAAAWGAEGACKFRIASTLIVRPRRNK